MQRVASIVELEYAHKRHITGKGINVAVLDSGITKHSELMNRNNRFIAAYDAVNGREGFYDDNGHGTHVAGIIGGCGRVFRGMAPECGLISVKILDRSGGGKTKSVINGMKWILHNKKRYNIRIVNISIGASESEKYESSLELIEMVEKLWDAGIIVVSAAGNKGPKAGSVGVPGISRKIITVGASDDDGRYRRETYSHPYYSGRGPTSECIMKPDVVAPGSGVVSLGINGRYSVKSGTSMSTPVVTGAVALLLSKYPELDNRAVKMRLKNTVIDLGLPREKQGWGMINVRTLLEEKRVYEKLDY